MQLQSDKQTNINKKATKATKLLDLYIRNNKKQALLIHTNQNANISHINNTISARFGVPISDQILYYNGERLSPSEPHSELNVEDKSILHLVDRRNIRQNLVINIRKLNVPKIDQFRVPSSQIIEDFIVRNIQEEEANRLFLVYTGRQLNPRNSFAQQFVESESELFCLHETKDEVSGEKKQKYQKKLRTQNNKQQSNSNENKQSKLEEQAKQQMKQVKISQNYDKEQNKVSSRLQQYKQNLHIDSQKSNHSQRQIKQEKQEARTPNFKKKNISEQINLGDGQRVQTNINANQNNFSIIGDQNFQQTRSNIGQANFFNEGSSISSIMAEDHNPECNKKSEQASLMFHSAIMGLNNEVNQQNNNQRGNFIGNNQQDQQSESNNDSHPQKVSFSFENKAPQVIAMENRQFLGCISQEIIEQSRQDYTQSRQITNSNIQEKKQEQNSNLQGQKQGNIEDDNSQFQLQNVNHHQLSASAELGVEVFQNRNISGNVGNEILIQEANQQAVMMIEGAQIQPILYNQQRQQASATNKECSNKDDSSSMNSVPIATPYFMQIPNSTHNEVNIYLIQQENLAPNTASEIIQEKQQCQTNGRESGSGFYSSNSSRTKQNECNDFNFEQIQKIYGNKFSRKKSQKQQTPQIQKQQTPQIQIQINQVQRVISEAQSFKKIQQKKSDENYETLNVNNIKNMDQSKSLNIVQLPIQNRPRENSSLLVDYGSKSDLNFVDSSNEKSRKFQNQQSGIDQLNKLLSKIQSKAFSSKIQQNLQLPDNNKNVQHHKYKLSFNQNEEELIDTSLSKRLSKNRQFQTISPIYFKNIKGFPAPALESIESMERMSVENSVQHLTSKIKDVDNSQPTSQNQIYQIGEFVYNNQPYSFEPFDYFVNMLAKHELQQLVKSYP